MFRRLRPDGEPGWDRTSDLLIKSSFACLSGRPRQIGVSSNKCPSIAGLCDINLAISGNHMLSIGNGLAANGVTLW